MLTRFEILDLPRGEYRLTAHVRASRRSWRQRRPRSSRYVESTFPFEVARANVEVTVRADRSRHRYRDREDPGTVREAALRRDADDRDGRTPTRWLISHPWFRTPAAV